jgi:hypothetical protein
MCKKLILNIYLQMRARQLHVKTPPPASLIVRPGVSNAFAYLNHLAKHARYVSITRAAK